MSCSPVELLGLAFDDCNTTDVVNALLARPRGARFGYLVTPNADHLARLQRQPRLARLYQSAWLCVLDSRFIHNVAGLIGLGVPKVATGADIVRQLLDVMPPQTVAVIGLSAASLGKLQARYAHLNLVHHEPPPQLASNEIALRRARDFAVRMNARFTFIGLGSPLQEQLAFEIFQQPGATGTALCIGCALEYCAGTATRAPAMMRAAGLEWLYRLACNPNRLWRRYLIDDPPVLWALIIEKIVRLRRDRHPQAGPAARPGHGLYRPRPLEPLRKIPDEP